MAYARPWWASCRSVLSDQGGCCMQDSARAINVGAGDIEMGQPDTERDTRASAPALSGGSSNSFELSTDSEDGSSMRSEG